MVGPPKVINKTVNDKLVVPFEVLPRAKKLIYLYLLLLVFKEKISNEWFMQIAIVEVPEEYVGPVVELLGRRRGHMIDMQGTGY